MVVSASNDGVAVLPLTTAPIGLLMQVDTRKFIDEYSGCQARS